ncbi:hypothetical protein AMELA_G00075400 [Ameiurus melas]|uniref:Uncharacterized protein n=1 Tax=Ameiurus melas TaxID=219545 RepID=A0A7J6AYQ9_AMEME|nr:hypothetical protein AMELA_G00075400 [Ameiurus melas]
MNPSLRLRFRGATQQRFQSVPLSRLLLKQMSFSVHAGNHHQTPSLSCGAVTSRAASRDLESGLKVTPTSPLLPHDVELRWKKHRCADVGPADELKLNTGMMKNKSQTNRMDFSFNAQFDPQHHSLALEGQPLWAR